MGLYTVDRLSHHFKTNSLARKSPITGCRTATAIMPQSSVAQHFLLIQHITHMEYVIDTDLPLAAWDPTMPEYLWARYGMADRNSLSLRHDSFHIVVVISVLCPYCHDCYKSTWLQLGYVARCHLFGAVSRYIWVLLRKFNCLLIF